VLPPVPGSSFFTSFWHDKREIEITRLVSRQLVVFILIVAIFQLVKISNGSDGIAIK